MSSAGSKTQTALRWIWHLTAPLALMLSVGCQGTPPDDVLIAAYQRTGGFFTALDAIDASYDRADGKLRTVHVHHRAFTAAGLKMILERGKELDILEIEGALLTSDDCKLLPEFTRLRWLSIIDCPIDDEALRYIREMRQLKVLDLSGCEITTKGLQQLDTLRELEELRAAGTKLDHEALAYMPSRETLRFLDLRDTKLDDRSVKSFAEYEALVAVNLERTLISPDGLWHIQRLMPKLRTSPSPPQTKYIPATTVTGGPEKTTTAKSSTTKKNTVVGLDGNAQVSDPKDARPTLDEMQRAGIVMPLPSLADVAMDQPDVIVSVFDANNSPEEAFLQLAQDQFWCQAVTDKEGRLLFVDLCLGPLSGTPITADGLAKLTGLKAIRSLELAESELKTEELSVIGSLLGLRYLSLSGTQADNNLLRSLGPMPITTLYLSRTKVNGQGIAHLATLKQLHTLWLDGLPLTNESIATLQPNNLVELNLSGTGITNGSLAVLSQCKKLRRLNVSDTALTADAVKKLRVSLPQCQIEYSEPADKPGKTREVEKDKNGA